MKLVILGASGGCGRALVTQAQARGHAVTAAVRAASRVDAPSGVTVLRGDLCDVGFLRSAVRGQDVVVSALGHRLPGIAPWHRPEDPTFLDRSTRALLDAMHAEGVRRVMAISAGGAGDSAAQVPAAFRMFIRATALRAVYPTLERMEQLLLQSGLDVCIPRPTGLTDGPLTGAARAVARVQGRATVSRADVAAWMLDALEAPAFPARTPMITATDAG